MRRPPRQRLALLIAAMTIAVSAPALAQTAPAPIQPPALTAPGPVAPSLRLRYLQRQRATFKTTRVLGITGTLAGTGLTILGVYLIGRSNRDYTGDTCYGCIKDGLEGVVATTLGVSVGVASLGAWLISEVGLRKNERAMHMLVAPAPGGAQASLAFRF